MNIELLHALWQCCIMEVRLRWNTEKLIIFLVCYASSHELEYHKFATVLGGGGAMYIK
jgi:hypothetical protein